MSYARVPFGARVIEVIETVIELRGDGKEDPFRRVRQYWSKDGDLLAEFDPYSQADRAGK